MEQNEQQLMKLEGTVEHVIYENADTGYAVLRSMQTGPMLWWPAMWAVWTTACP